MIRKSRVNSEYAWLGSMHTAEKGVPNLIGSGLTGLVPYMGSAELFKAMLPMLKFH